MIASRQPPQSLSRRAVRFAPSPNGLLHLGHAYSVLMNDRLAHAVNGTMLLRFEDIDLARCTSAFERAILDDLAWLGLQWPEPVWRQSHRFHHYRAALDRLDRAGLVYPCFCTRGDITQAVGGRDDWPRDPDGSPLYPGTCRQIAEGERRRMSARGVASSLRLDMAKALDAARTPITWTEYGANGIARQISANPAAWGDVPLARKDIPTSYHVSVVVDDAAQDITDVVRGEDLFHATSLHRLLQALLDLPEPAYHHHTLIRDEHGAKLSKSRQSPTLLSLRQAGTSAEDVRRLLGFHDLDRHDHR